LPPESFRSETDGVRYGGNKGARDVRTLIRTDDLASTDRFAYYREQLLRAQIPLDSRCDRPAVFRATLTATQFGPLIVTSLSTRCDEPYEVLRTPALIRRSDPGAYRLVLNKRGRSRLAQDGRENALGTGDLGLYDMSRPFDGWRGPDMTPNEWVMVTFPRALLPLSPSVVRPLLGVPMSGSRDVGALVSGFVGRLAADLDLYAPQDVLGLSATLVDLVAILVAHTAGDTAPEPDHRTLMVRVQAFIRNRLGDPGLTPAMVAAAHNISTRQLQRLFQASGLTVAGWIRELRLERCRRDLADPLLRGRPVHLVAARWGFTDAAHFSHVFRSAYGLGPKAYREGAVVNRQPLGADGQRHRDRRSSP
jgi:AraC-like DNA-binding protein